jgi:hypothetical protein
LFVSVGLPVVVPTFTQPRSIIAKLKKLQREAFFDDSPASSTRYLFDDFRIIAGYRNPVTRSVTASETFK